MDQRIAVNFRCRCLQNARVNTLRHSEHVDHSHHARLHRLHGIILVMNGRCGTGEIVDLIDLEQDRLGHIMTDELELFIVEKMDDVLLSSGEKIVEANNFITFGQKSFAQMRTDKPGTAGNENSHKSLTAARDRRFNRRDGETPRKITSGLRIALPDFSASQRLGG